MRQAGPEALAWVRARAEGKVWWYRAPLLLVLAWILRGYAADPLRSSIFSGISLGFHEMGHAAFSWFGNSMLTAAGGTIFELGVPIAAGVYLLIKQRDPFGAAVCLFWLGTALVGSGVYAADARAQVLPLVSPFGPVDVDSHDWTFILMKYGMLTKDEAIGGALKGAGMAIMTVSTVVGSWLVWTMASVNRARSAQGGSELPS